MPNDNKDLIDKDRYYQALIEIDSRLASIENSIQNFPAQIEKLDSKVDSAISDANAANTHIDNLSRRVDKLETEQAHSRDTSNNIWIAIVTTVISSIVALWTTFK